MIYGHHCVYDVFSSHLICSEILHIYKNIINYKIKDVTHEKGVLGLIEATPYSTILKDFYKIQKVKYNEAYEYIKEKYLNIDLCNNYLKDINDYKSSQTSFNIPFNDKNVIYITSKNIKYHQIFKTLFQIALVIVLDINPIPIYNINGKRPLNAMHTICSYLKQQPFISNVNYEYTILQQYKYNIKTIKEFLKNFDNFDFDKVQMNIFKNEKKDFRPKIIFNYFKLEKDEYIARPDLYNDYNEIWGSENEPINMFYEICMDELNNISHHEFVFKTSVFDYKIQNNIIKLIWTMFNNIETYLYIKIKDIKINNYKL
jgi:hypothetical protein